ncbi:MAG: alanine racemase [Pseudohongiellaceae bacterium]
MSDHALQPVRRAWADIDLAALQHNFSVACRISPESRALAVVKANAYGHGLRPVAAALEAVMREGDAFAVASLQEGIMLRGLQLARPILVMQGVQNADELELARRHGLWLVVHSPHQVSLMSEHSLTTDCWHLWLKLETGMNRLGLEPDVLADAWQALGALPGVGHCVLMSHLACSDDPGSDSTRRQLDRLDALIAATLGMDETTEVSVAASGGILVWPDARRQWLRPGIMLYGGSPVLGETGPDRDLRPVMTLRARLVSVKTVQAGESVGYGATYTAGTTHRMGIASIGYGDGYPRHAPTGTPVVVLVNGRPQRTRLIGRVSMDMVNLDLEGIDAGVGDEVILWGEHLPADEIARHCDTISYELFCQVTSRVDFRYHGFDDGTRGN